MKQTFRTQTISDFRRSGAKCVARLRRHGEPLLLTVRGKATVIVQSIESFEQMMEELTAPSELAKLRTSLSQANRNEGVSVDRAFASVDRILKVCNK